jgi:hypothetical protein
MSQRPPDNFPEKYSVEEHMFSQLVILNKRIYYLNIVVTVLGVFLILASLIYGYFLFFAPAPPPVME